MPARKNNVIGDYCEKDNPEGQQGQAGGIVLSQQVIKGNRPEDHFLSTIGTRAATAIIMPQSKGYGMPSKRNPIAL